MKLGIEGAVRPDLHIRKPDVLNRGKDKASYRETLREFSAHLTQDLQTHGHTVHTVSHSPSGRHEYQRTSTGLPYRLGDTRIDVAVSRTRTATNTPENPETYDFLQASSMLSIETWEEMSGEVMRYGKPSIEAWKNIGEGIQFLARVYAPFENFHAIPELTYQAIDPKRFNEDFLGTSRLSWKEREELLRTIMEQAHIDQDLLDTWREIDTTLEIPKTAKTVIINKNRPQIAQELVDMFKLGK